MPARLQPIYDIAVLCARKGLRQAVLCPGSRCAPLTVAFARHPDIHTRTISDERSAGFIALGISQQTFQPTALLCTSGTAAYNFAPAVAEAYFSKTPLLIFTADRPSEWIAQQDGQTIYQSEIFGKHVKKSYQLPQEYENADSRWAINRMINEAINISKQEPQGPVHVNVPFREPLYPTPDEQVGFSDSVRVMEEHVFSFELSEAQKKVITEGWTSYGNVLVIAGQQHFDKNLIDSLTQLLRFTNIPVVGDIISNLHSVNKFIVHSDLFLGQCDEGIFKTLKPDLLISFGHSTISKNLKLFLRKYKATRHWHIQPGGMVADTYQTITDVFHSTPVSFFNFLASLPIPETFETQKRNHYYALWEAQEGRASRTLDDYFPENDFGELALVNEVIKNLPAHCNLHLANSMSVRYANFVGLSIQHEGVHLFSNRGTSGIDGCTSTCVGHTLSSDIPNVLITGDLAFFYDRNAFWHNYPMTNLRIVLLNNHGGIIFKMIDGPGKLPEADEYFVTRQRLTAKHLCEEFGMDYLKLDHKENVKNLLQDFFSMGDCPKVLELETELNLNQILFENLKLKMRKSYEL